MDWSWIQTSLTSALMVVITAVGIYVALIALVRWSGVRSFSQISSFDFAITIAIGSLISRTILTKNPPLLQALAGLGALFFLQMVVARFRNHKSVSRLVDNRPVLVMKGSKMLLDNMKQAKINRSDLLGKLRENNVQEVEHIHAVVMETTGNISVLYGGKVNENFDTSLLGGLKEEFEQIDIVTEDERLVDIRES